MSIDEPMCMCVCMCVWVRLDENIHRLSFRVHLTIEQSKKANSLVNCLHSIHFCCFFLSIFSVWISQLGKLYQYYSERRAKRCWPKSDSHPNGYKITTNLLRCHCYAAHWSPFLQRSLYILTAMYPDRAHRHHSRRERVNGKGLLSNIFSNDVDLIWFFSIDRMRYAVHQEKTSTLNYAVAIASGIATALLLYFWTNSWVWLLITIRSIPLMQSQWNQQKYRYLRYKIIYYAECKFSICFLLVFLAICFAA